MTITITSLNLKPITVAPKGAKCNDANIPIEEKAFVLNWIIRRRMENSKLKLAPVESGDENKKEESSDE